MPTADFQSFLAPTLREYLDYLAGLGYSTVTPTHDLCRLDRFWARHGFRDLDELPVHWALEMQPEAPELAGNTWRGLRHTFHGLCRYLIRVGRLKKDLISTWPRPRVEPYHPYVFSPAELRRFFDHLKDRARQARTPLRFYQNFSDYAFYHLLYACGLRVSEAVHLGVDDYCPQPTTLWIRPSKFGKDRLLPLGRRVDLNLRNLLDLRRRWFPSVDAGRLFVLPPRGRPYTRGRASDYFRLLLRRLGIYQPRRSEQGVRYGTPHLHELRRSFAVHRLLAWYRQGADLNTKLPLLATYMGHARFEYTKIYLPLTEELLREANQRFSGRFDRLDR